MKKYLLNSIAVISAVSVLTFQSVSAVTFDATSGLNTDTSVITVKGEIDNKLLDRPVNIDITIGDECIYAESLTTEDNGKFEVKVKIPDGTESGSVAVKARGYQEAASTVLLPAPWYAAPRELIQLTEDLNDGTKSLEDVLSNSENADFINLNIQLSCWDSSLAPEVAKLLEGVKFTSAGDIKEKVYTAAIIALIREKEAADAVDFLEETDDGGQRISLLKLDKQAEELFLYDNKVALFAASNMDKECATAAEFVSDFEKKNALGYINQSGNWGTLNNRIGEVAELLGQDEHEDAMDKFTSDSGVAADVGKVLVEELPFTDAEDLWDTLEEIVGDVTKEDDDDTPSRGSGSRGGGGGGSSVATPGTSNTDENKKPAEENQGIIFFDLDESHWAYDSIMAMAQKEIINGDGSGAFYPEKAVTREEFVKMLVLAIGFDISNSQEIPYTDVSANDWFYPYVSVARSKGLVLGVTETEFGTGDIITREQMATICFRAAEMTGKDLSGSDVVEFTDQTEISDYAKEAVRILASGGILKGIGDNSFVPHGEVTRAQAAHVIFNIYRTEGM